MLSAANQPVIAVAERVAARLASQLVVAGPSRELLGSAATEHRVRALAPEHHVGALASSSAGLCLNGRFADEE